MKNNNSLVFTGERMMPEFNNGDLVFFEHISRYFFASQVARGKTVLDIACGVGYGAYYIAKQGAKEVVGVDVDAKTIAYAKERYKKKNLKFNKGSAEEIPLNNSSIDIIVSFETIEHVADYKKFLKETKRVLKKDGVAIFSTPNKEVFSGNPFHVKEFSLDEFSSELRCFYKNVDIYFQTNIVSTTISTGEWLEQFSIQNEEIIKKGTQCPEESLYFVAVCSNHNTPELKRKIFLNNNRELKRLYAEVEAKTDKNIINKINSINIKKLEKKNQEIRQKDRAIKQKEKELQKVYTSNSWKITEPLRTARRILSNRKGKNKSGEQKNEE